METFDAIVLGTGGVGSAALYHLARGGARVLGIDRFPPGHDRGSSHGETRIIRRAYFEHPDYVPLCQAAYDEWAALEQETGEALLRQTGLLQVGPAEGEVVRGVLDSARQHQLGVEQLSASEVHRRFPGFRVPDGQGGVFEPEAGLLWVERCVRAYASAAQRHGANLRTGETVLRWQAGGRGISVETDGGRYSAAGLLITAGAWAPVLLGELGLPFEVRRKPLLWFATDSDAYRLEAGAPAFLFETPTGVFYGFPDVGTGELKVAEHSGGERVADPLHVDRELHVHDAQPIQSFLQQHLPGVSTRVTRHSVCMYTLTPDQHFIVDRHPQHACVAFAAGLSGHGFKFVGVLGRAMGELLREGRTSAPIEFLNCRRPALRC